MNDHIEFNKDISLRVKGIAVLLMIAHHLFTHDLFSKINTVALPQYYEQIGIMGKICVSIFMFIGGYAFLLSKENSLIKRLWHIYKKFIITFFIVTTILFFSHKLYVNTFQYVRNALCISWEINGSWWFISTYILYLVFFYCIHKYLHKCSKNIQFLIFIPCSIVLPYLAQYIRTMHEINDIIRIQLHYFLYYISFFYLGLIFFQFKLFNLIRKNSKSIVILILFLCVIFCIRIFMGINWINYILVPLIIALMCFIPYKEFLFLFLGKYSMSMWLVHMFFIEERYFLRQIILFSSPIFMFIIITILSLVYSIIESHTILISRQCIRVIKNNFTSFKK